VKLDAGTVRRFRWRSGGLDARLGHDALPAGAWAGLQDTAPRSGLLSLHARVEAVAPESWADAGLTQVWGPRLAVYVVRRADLGVFTLGRLPRDPQLRRRLERMAELVHRTLNGTAMGISELFPALGDRPGHAVRAACATGRFVLRWDARTNSVVPVDRPEIEPEQARYELARRYLHWLGPGTAETFGRWAGIDEGDARQTWNALAPELRPVEFGKGERAILAADADALSSADQPSGVDGVVRLLPPNDPYLWPDRGLLVDSAAQYAALYQPKGEAAGAISVDGTIVGVWARQQNRVTLRPWAPLSAATREAVTDAAQGFRGPIGRDITLTVDETVPYGQSQP
jgi:hypothetical protein